MKRTIIAVMLISLGLLSACKNEKGVITDNQATSEETNDITENIKENKTESSEGKEETKRELTKEELKDFSRFVINTENYGFLLSNYKTPNEIDLNEVFYNGAEIKTQQLSSEEEAAYLNKIGETKIDTDYIRLSTKQMEDFLQKKLGVSLEKEIKQLDWTYLPEYDIWVSQHGDSNYVSFACTKGQQIGKDTFVLECASGNEYVSDTELTLRKSGDTYQFVSNRYIDKIQNPKSLLQMKEQSFDVNLDGWGDVTFVSYEPQISTYADEDATFGLLKGENEIYTFPGMEENNLRGWTFEGVIAVAFKDYNKNGKKDIIIINEYAPSAGPTVAQGFYEVRLYTQYGQEKDFVLDSDITDYLNDKGFNSSIQEVMEETSAFKDLALEDKKIGQEEAWKKLKASSFADVKDEKIEYDAKGNIRIIIATWKGIFGDETKERYGQTVVSYDSEEADNYNFACYKEFNEEDGSIFATQTQGWYKVNAYTGSVILE